MVEKERLRELLEHHTNAQVAEQLGVNVRTIARWRKSMGLDRQEVKFKGVTLNDFQIELFNACLLGDGSIEHLCNRFRFGQKLDKKEYVAYLCDSLKPFSCEPYPDDNGYQSYRFYTYAHDWFAEQKKLWYRDRVKVVPKTFKLTPTIFLHWFLQDGTNNQLKKSLTLYTNCFSFDEVEYLKARLLIDLDINSSINTAYGQPVIYIGAEDYFKTLDLIRGKMIWKCFDYKVDVSRVKVNVNVNLKPNKINYEIAREIEKMYQTDESAKSIAELYNISISSVYNVINGATYPRKEFAEISVVNNVSVESSGSRIS